MPNDNANTPPFGRLRITLTFLIVLLALILLSVNSVSRVPKVIEVNLQSLPPLTEAQPPRVTSVATEAAGLVGPVPLPINTAPRNVHELPTAPSEKPPFWPLSAPEEAVPMPAASELRLVWVKPPPEGGDVAQYLHRIRMSEGMKCDTMLSCTIELHRLLVSAGELCYATLLIMTGTGAVARCMLPRPQADRFGMIGVAVEVAHMVRKPAFFYALNWDEDKFHEHVNGFHGDDAREPYRSIMEFPNFFNFICSPIVDHQGRLPPRHFPIPHLMSQSAFPTRSALSERLQQHDALVSSFSQRPRRAVWRGSTTGHAEAKYFQAHRLGPKFLQVTDRGRVVQLFQGHPEINDVFISGLVQKVHLPHQLLRPHLSQGRSWSDRGRLLLDIDGNVNAWESLRWKLEHGGPVLKINSTKNHVQWYYYLLEHKVHLYLADLRDPDFFAKVGKYLDDVQSAASVMSNAMKFSQEHLTGEAVMAFSRDIIGNCWENVEKLADRDWRIKLPLDEPHPQFDQGPTVFIDHRGQ